MQRLINRFKYLIHTDIFELYVTPFDLFILILSAIWGIVLFLILPLSLILSLF